MKIRSGFVSNSSSSSFVIASEKKLTKKMLTEVFGIPKGHPFYKLASEAVQVILDRAQLAEESDDWQYLDADERAKILKKGKYVYTGIFTDDDPGQIEALLCWMDLKVKGDGFVLEHESGY